MTGQGCTKRKQSAQNQKGMRRLFDSIHRTDGKRRRPAESSFEFLNRYAEPRARRVRMTLESWFGRYPGEHTYDLRQRFRSRQDTDHMGAFFELYMYTLLQRNGLNPKPHAAVPGSRGKVDFLLGKAGQNMILECIAAHRHIHDEKYSDVRQRLIEAIDRRIDPVPATLMIEVTSGSAATPSVKRIAHDISQWLWIKQQSKGLDERTFVVDQWHFRVQILAWDETSAGRNRRRNIEVQWYGVYDIDSIRALRSSLEKKAGKYGSTSLPYVIAVDSVLGFMHEAEEADFLQALFGTERYGYDASGRAFSRRDKDGVLFGPDGPQHTSVSAVLSFSELSPFTIAKTEPVLYVNPWADVECPTDWWPGKTAEFVPATDEIRYSKGRLVRTILGKSADWPDR